MNKIYFFLLNYKNSNRIIICLILGFIFSFSLLTYNFSANMPNWLAYLQGSVVTFYLISLIISIYLIPVIKNRILIYISLLSFVYLITGNFYLFKFFGQNFSGMSEHFFNSSSLFFKITTLILWTIRICVLNLLFHEFTRKFYSNTRNKLFYKFNKIIIVLTLFLIILSICFKNNNIILFYYTLFFNIILLCFFIFRKKTWLIFSLFLFLISTSSINSLRVFYVDLFPNSTVDESLLYSKSSILISSVVVFIQIILLVISTLKHVENKNNYLLASINTHKNLLHETQLMAANLEINMLTAAIKPHFLFNCLNSIEILMSNNLAKAEESIYNLSYFYRYFLLNLKGELVWFKDELTFVERYVKMENIRFNDIIILTVNTNNYFRFKIPPFSLQLIVENAIVHSITKSKKIGEIIIQINKIDSHYKITIVNSKNHTQEENFYNKKGSGMGLTLLTQRLELAFGKKNTNIFIENTESHYSISFSVPEDDC